MLTNLLKICLDINEILPKSQYFLRVYEFAKKFREARMRNSEEQKIVRKLSSGIRVKFDGYDIISNKFSRKVRRHFAPINVIYKPVKKKNNKILCYSTTDIFKAYRSSCDSNGKIKHCFAYECFYCSKFFVRHDRFTRNVKTCSGVPGVVYNFNIQNLVTFEENLKYKGDLPMTVCFDFETTAPTDTYYDPEQKEMFVVSHIIIVAFHPKLTGLHRVMLMLMLLNNLKMLLAGLLLENVKKH